MRIKHQHYYCFDFTGKKIVSFSFREINNLIIIIFS